MVAVHPRPPADAIVASPIHQSTITAAVSIASLPLFYFVDCCIAATAAAFVANGPSSASCPVGCCVASSHANTSRPPVPPPLAMPPSLIMPVLCLLSGKLSHCFLSCWCLPSTSASTTCCTAASCCAPLVCVLSGWLMHLLTPPLTPPHGIFNNRPSTPCQSGRSCVRCNWSPGGRIPLACGPPSSCTRMAR